VMDTKADDTLADQIGTSAEGYLSSEETKAALDELTEADMLRLMAIERRLLSGTDLSTGDLYHEAVVRTLHGNRKCPRHVPIIAFIVETMRSIASHTRGRVRREMGQSVSIDEHANLLTGGTDPEEILLQSENEAAIVLQAIEEAFSDDEHAQLLLMCWGDNLHGKELREALGLGQAELDYLIKRVRRKVRKMYPTGWHR